MLAPSQRAILAAVCLAAIFMGGCRNEPQVVVKHERSDAAADQPTGLDMSINIDAQASTDPLAELPTFAPVYPGAQIKTRMIRPMEDGPGGTLLVMETRDSIEKVAAFYDAQAKKAGVTPSMFVNEADGAVRIFGGRDGPDSAGGALIAISKSDEGQGTEIVITAGSADAQMEPMDRERGDWRPTARPDVRLQ